MSISKNRKIKLEMINLLESWVEETLRMNSNRTSTIIIGKATFRNSAKLKVSAKKLFTSRVHYTL